MVYATVVEFCNSYNILGDTYDRENQTLYENIGQASTSKTRYVLNNGSIIGDLDLYYGSAEQSATALSSTAYSIDSDKGIITLGSTAVTLVGTNNLYADYNYCIIGLNNTQITQALNQSEREITTLTNQIWVDGSVATPTYGQATNEEYDGKGRYDRAYYLNHFPIPIFSAVVSSTATSSSTSITVVSTDGFPTSGVIGSGTNKILYTGKSSTAFTGVSGITSDLNINAMIYPFVIESSNTEAGYDNQWTILQKDIDYHINYTTGRIYLYGFDYDSLALGLNFPARIPNRFRANYVYGHQTISDDIKRLNIIMAAQNLTHATVSRAVITGKDNFTPNIVSVDKEEIARIVAKYADMGGSNI
jgi:hypothetical protein